MKKCPTDLVLGLMGVCEIYMVHELMIFVPPPRPLTHTLLVSLLWATTD